MRAATRMASIRLDGSARPFQAMSKAVPWATLVRTIGSPRVTLTATGCFECDMPLVVIHRHDGVVCAGQRVIEKRVIGKRPRDVDPLAAGQLDGGVDDRLLFVAKEAAFTRMRIEGGYGDARRQAAGQRPHRPVGQADLRRVPPVVTSSNTRLRAT